MNSQPFIFGEPKIHDFPLNAYLPPYQASVVKSWLKTHAHRSGLVLCPFGSSPQVALEAARSGFQVLLPVHNPILRFLIQHMAQPPSREVLNTALARLASTYKGKERLKPYLLSLYQTDCPQCGKPTPASSFTWSKISGTPVQKTCRCSACGEETEGTVTADDLKKANNFQENSPTHARALIRVAAPDDPIRFQVESALRSYPARSVYALFSVLNKITGLNLPLEEESHLEILLLNAFYRCSHQLRPNLATAEKNDKEGEFFREENVWFAIEEALEIWAGDEQEVTLTTWPTLPPEAGGLTIFPGRVKDLIPQLNDKKIHSVVMVFPKPTPNFWALSALWTGWLWGQEAAGPLRSILTIKNFDWTWMTRAIETTLSGLTEILSPGTPCFGLLPEIEINSLLSGLSAALSAGFQLDNIAVEPDQRTGQTSWIIRKKETTGNLVPREIIRESGLKLLNETGEPRHTFSIYSAGIAALAASGYLQDMEDTPDPEIYYPQILKDFEENIAYRQGFLHYPKIETWWHQDFSLPISPQADQVEKALVALLVDTYSSIPEMKIFQQIFDQFPAVSTPREGLIQACLHSYAEKDPLILSNWRLKPNDNPPQRKKDLQEIETIINNLGHQLGFEVSQEVPLDNIIHLIWKKEDQPLDSFFISASGLLNKIITHEGVESLRKWIILPGSRAELIHYKMNQNPPISDIVQRDWGLVKYRHIRRLSELGGLTGENIMDRLNLDPFTSDSPQLQLI